MADTPKYDQDQFDKQFAPTVSAEDFDSKYGKTDPKVYSGSLADQFFSQTAVGRVMNAFGQGAQQNWQTSSNIEGELKDWANKIGLESKFAKDHEALGKVFNEGFIRPAMHGFPGTGILDAGINTVKGVLGAPIAAVGQAGEEFLGAAKHIQEDENTPNWGVSKQLLAPALGSIGETLSAVTPRPFQTDDPTNQAVASALPDLAMPHVASVARAQGVIGEGEVGYFNTKIPSPTALQERQGAAQEAGIQVPPVEPPVTDPNLLARRINPDLFKEWDHLKDTQDNIRLSLQAERTKFRQAEEVGLPDNHPDQIKRAAGIQSLQENLQSADERVRDLIPKAADARARVEELINSDSPEGQAFRDYTQKVLLENELRMSDMLDDVRLAEGHAESLLPDPLNARKGEIPENPNGESKSGTPDIKTPEKIIEPEPPIGHGMIRLYHGAAEGGAPEADGLGRWATTQRGQAQNYGEGNRDLWYVDVPQDSTIGQRVRGRPADGVPGDTHLNLPDEYVKDMKRLKTSGVNDKGQLVPYSQIEKPRTSGLGKKIEAGAIEQGLTDSFGGLPEYESINMKDQALGVEKVINEDYGRAKRIAFGREEPGSGEPRPLSFLVGVEKQARADGDVETLRRLANSNLVSETSRAAQDLRTLAERDPTNPVSIMRDIDMSRKARKDAQTKKTMEDIVDNIKKATRDDPSAWETFIKSIECDY